MKEIKELSMQSPSGVSFDCTEQEFNIITRIVARAMKLCDNEHIIYGENDCRMDLAACHKNGTPLDLEKLLKVDEFTFRHDVFGINKHIDREIGKLTDCFLPRCSMSE